MEDMLERTSGLLSDLTLVAAVVVGPSHEQAASARCKLWASALDSPCSSWCSPTAPSRSARSSSPRTGRRAPRRRLAALAREVVGHLLSGAANLRSEWGQQLDRVLAPLVLPDRDGDGRGE